MPNTIEPSGRITNPTPKTANVSSNEDSGSFAGKNCAEIVETKYP